MFMSIRIRSGCSALAICDACLAVDGDEHLEPAPLEPPRQRVAVLLVIFDDQNLWHSRRPPVLRTGRGRGAWRLSARTADQLRISSSRSSRPYAPFCMMRSTCPDSRPRSSRRQVLGGQDDDRDRPPRRLLAGARPGTRTRPSPASSGRAGSRGRRRRPPAAPGPPAVLRLVDRPPVAGQDDAAPPGWPGRPRRPARDRSRGADEYFGEDRGQPVPVDRLRQVLRRPEDVTRSPARSIIVSMTTGMSASRVRLQGGQDRPPVHLRHDHVEEDHVRADRRASAQPLHAVGRGDGPEALAGERAGSRGRAPPGRRRSPGPSAVGRAAPRRRSADPPRLGGRPPRPAAAP